MSRYTHFPSDRITILSESIIGFESVSQLYGCNLILETGARIFLNRTSEKDAKDIFEWGRDVY